MKQREHNHDAGVTFAGTENSTSTVSDLLEEIATPSTQSEHSHDAGIVFGATEGNRNGKAQDGSIRSIAETMLKFGTASARFTLDQVESGVYMLTDPRRAVRRVQHSIDNFARAMNEPV